MYDEEAVLPELLAALAETFSAGTRKQHRIDRVRCLFIDDGSRDSSVSMVQNARLPGLEVRIVRLSRNFGHQAAVSAGIAHSSSDLVAVIDADLQDPPACILEMLDSWRSGFEVVYAQRRNRKEGWSKRLMYWAFYRLFRALSPVSVPVDSGDFCLMSRRVVEVLNQLPETVRFPRGLRSWIGFAQTSIQLILGVRFNLNVQFAFGWIRHRATSFVVVSFTSSIRLHFQPKVRHSLFSSRLRP